MPITKHGLRKSKEYNAWQHMMSRCTNPKSEHFKRYGGRGISVCEQWRTFDGFFKDVGYAPSPKHSLDRHPDNNGNYEPSNVRWATHKEQQRNRTDNAMHEYNGMTKSLADWADIYNIPYSTLSTRIHQSKWSIEKAVTTPVKKITLLTKKQVGRIRIMCASGLPQTHVAAKLKIPSYIVHSVFRNKSYKALLTTPSTTT